MSDTFHTETVTGQRPYDVIGITPPSQRFNGQPPELISCHVERDQLCVAGDDEIADRINDPFAFCKD